MSERVNIADLNVADVLAALYNASKPMGMGFLQAGGAPNVMDRAHAEQLLRLGSDASGDYPLGTAVLRGNPRYFDYVYGRPLKLDLSPDNEDFDPWGFDRDNGGEGTAQRVIDHLRATGSVERADGTSFLDEELDENQSAMYMISLLRRNNP